MHLGPDGPATREAFLAFLQAAADGACALLLPGDIFDAWVGDDEIDAPAPWLQAVLDGLRAASARIPVHLGLGNRGQQRERLGTGACHRVPHGALPDERLGARARRPGPPVLRRPVQAPDTVRFQSSSAMSW